MAPIVVLVLALVAYPFCYAVYLSMTRKYVGMPPVWVGLENYVRLTYDGFFQRAVVNSFTFTFASVAIKTGARHGHGAGAHLQDPLPMLLDRGAADPVGRSHRGLRAQLPVDLRLQPRAC